MTNWFNVISCLKMDNSLDKLKFVPHYLGRNVYWKMNNKGIISLYTKGEVLADSIVLVSIDGKYVPTYK